MIIGDFLDKAWYVDSGWACSYTRRVKAEEASVGFDLSLLWAVGRFDFGHIRGCGF
jgi:hypothetical protein